MVCHKKCNLPFTKDGTALLQCWINDDGKCRTCGCPTPSHTHALIEYYDLDKETVAYKTLKREVDLMKEKEGV